MADGHAGVLHGLRVLLVEDVAVLAWQVRDILMEAGAVVAGPAPSVADALGLLAESDVDAAVLDMNLNGESADPIADTLAARGVPFLFVTGYGSSATKGRHADRPTLGKPFRAAILVQALASLMGRRPDSES